MDLMKYVDSVKKAYEEAYKSLDEWRMEREKEKLEVSARADKLTREAAVEEHNAFVAKYEEKSRGILDTLKAEIAGIRVKYKQEVKAFYSANGENIDPDDMAVLSSGIMTENEVSEMVVKHAENPTMLRIIGKHAIELKMKLETKIERAFYCAAKGGEKEIAVFEQLQRNLHTAVLFATGEGYSRELFLNTALKADQYRKDAEIALLEAKLFIDEDIQRKLDQYAEEQIEQKNKKYDPHSTDYNWM